MTIAVVLGAVLAGCKGHTRNTPPPSEPPALTAEDALVADMLDHHRFHHHGGMLLLLAMSLDELGLPEATQRQVERIQADLLGKLQPAAEAERALVGLLTSGVSAMSISAAALDAAIADVALRTAAAQQAAIDDLNGLHAALTPAERMALIDRLEAHWALWKQANVGEQDHVTVLGLALGLRPDQRARARAALTAHAGTALPDTAAEAQLRQLASTFVTASFDARGLTAADIVDRDMTAAGAAQLARFCQAVNPVLDELQREALVAMLQAHLHHGATPAVQP